MSEKKKPWVSRLSFRASRTKSEGLILGKNKKKGSDLEKLDELSKVKFIT